MNNAAAAAATGTSEGDEEVAIDLDSATKSDL
eukprot:CAMPEP_0176347676 /NCGR_PEP_ID=MMETSP0126-20121128/7258_1 /TAXON_ID=141414 ORGANISM="Strombidinopsis acuminatum, Strain SPMC142" /NCGR_SAMPLE_ID=MMETSP0126 /ASSEMBLY_ACC=CAM_ASM_000229 /LENGTH=31 /DNA_ID= /DNA_START= /DNA_END= /DNA_ORIENTATION=